MSLTISATALGELAQSGFCSRCFWIKRTCKLPYQTFPGIFSSIDGYIKKVVHRYFQREGQMPSWFPMSDQVAALEEVPHYSKFAATDPRSGVTLRGAPDDVLRLEGSAYHIVDYKTSRLSSAANAMFPSYEVQLNAYAYIGKRTIFSPVSGLSLIYLDPDTDLDSFPGWLDRSEEEFMLGFSAKLRPVALRPDGYIEELLRQAGEIMANDTPPDSAPECRECQNLERLIEVTASGG